MKLSIVGDAYVLTSTLTVNEVALLKKCSPGELRVKDEDGNDQFAVSYSEGRPCISKFGITFGGTTHDEDKFLTVTGMIPAGTGDCREYLADLVAPAVAYLKLLEERIPTVAERIKAEHDALVAAINVN